MIPTAFGSRSKSPNNLAHENVGGPCGQSALARSSCAGRIRGLLNESLWTFWPGGSSFLQSCGRREAKSFLSVSRLEMHLKMFTGVHFRDIKCAYVLNAHSGTDAVDSGIDRRFLAQSMKGAQLKSSPRMARMIAVAIG